MSGPLASELYNDCSLPFIDLPHSSLPPSPLSLPPLSPSLPSLPPSPPSLPTLSPSLPSQLQHLLEQERAACHDLEMHAKELKAQLEKGGLILHLLTLSTHILYWVQ